MFGAMGSLHRELAGLDVAVPRPRVATYGPPATLRRLLPQTEPAVRGDPAAAESARSLRRLAGRLRSQWIPAAELPQQLLHGDVRLSNVPRAPDGAPVYFDFGFLARRPRIHELAYSLSWMLLRPDSQGTAESFPWDTLPGLVAVYEEAARVTLTQLERRALVPYTAAVPIYLAALAGRMPDPIGHLLAPTRQQFLRIGDWLLAHPHAVSAALARPVP
jgi:Ser/Thr protein kinase RdoA (MazF antagonist)